MSKPQFDPNQPYEEVGAGAKPAFNPNQPYEEAPQTISFGPTMPQASSEQVALENNPEASLGLWNRARYALEPIQTNKEALLKQEYGAQNVFKSNNGELFLNQDGELRPLNASGVSMADAADIAGALPETIPQYVGTGAGLIGAGVEAVGTGGVGLIGAVPTVAAGRFVGGALGSGLRQGLSAMAGTPQEAGASERVKTAAMSGALNAGIGLGLDKASPYVSKAYGGLKAKLAPASDAISKGVGIVGDEIGATFPSIKSAADTISTFKKSTENTIDALKKSFSLKEAPDSKKLLETAKRYGIDHDVLPDAVRYGRNSFVSRLERSNREGPLGEASMDKFTEAHQQVGKALESIADEFSLTRPKDAKEAGKFIKDSIDDVGKGLIGEDAVTYKSAVENFPGLKMTKSSQDEMVKIIDELDEFAKTRLERGFGQQIPEAKSILDATRALKSSDGSLAQTIEFMNNLGEEAFKPRKPGDVPLDEKKMQALYFKLREEATNTISEAYGKDAAADLTKNNEIVSTFINQKKALGKILDNKNASAEDIFNSLIANGGSHEIQTLKTILPPEKIQALKGHWLESIVKKDADNLVSFKKTINELASKKNKNIASALFDEGELKNFTDVLELGKGMGDRVLSHSGTGGSNAFHDMTKTVKGSITSDANLELVRKRAIKANAPSPVKRFERSYINKGSVGSPAIQGNNALKAIQGPDVDYSKFYGADDEKENERKPSSKFKRKSPWL